MVEVDDEAMAVVVIFFSCKEGKNLENGKVFWFYLDLFFVLATTCARFCECWTPSSIHCWIVVEEVLEEVVSNIIIIIKQ